MDFVLSKLNHVILNATCKKLHLKDIKNNMYSYSFILIHKIK